MNCMSARRREFLQQSSALVGLAGGLAVGAGSAQSATRPLVDITATQAVAAMRKGEIKAEVYANALLERAAQAKDLNAFISLDRDATLSAARAADLARASGRKLGLLHGLPIPVKDTVNTAALPTTSGTRSLGAFRPKQDAPVIRSLFEAGAILMGKTNVHELSYGWTSNNAFTGAVRNPYDLTRIPGGSSGGSAAAVAARVAPLAVAEDTYGSIRVPATMCGICGIRPTFGRYSNEGVMPIAPAYLDAVGPLARSVSDLALFDAAISGEHSDLDARPLKGVRIGVAADFFLKELHSEVEIIMMKVLARLKDAGAVIVWAELPDIMKEAMLSGFFIQQADTVPAITNYLKQYADGGITFDQVLNQMSPGTRWVFDTYSLPTAQSHPTDAMISHARALIPQIRIAMDDYFRQRKVDVMAFPPVLMPPPLIGEDAEVDIEGRKLPIWYAMGRNISVGSTASLPGLVLPGGVTRNGLPVGIEFDAPRGEDRALLALGLSIEKVLGPIPAPHL